MDITIEKMTSKHLEQIKDILQEQFDEFWNENVLRKELENPLSDYIVAISNNEVVGYAGIWQPLDEGHITNIVTKKDKRNNHIGQEMLEKLIDIAINKKLKYVTLEVNVHNKIAIELYKKYEELKHIHSFILPDSRKLPCGTYAKRSLVFSFKEISLQFSK